MTMLPLHDILHRTGLAFGLAALLGLTAGCHEVPLPEEIQHDLIAAIQAYASRPENKFSFNLNCEHDIDLKFIIKDKCTDCGNYMCTGVYINDWLVHSFKTVLQ